MTFKDFQASRKFTESIGEELSDDAMTDIPGFVYDDSTLFIELHIGPSSSRGAFTTIDGSKEFASNDLNKVERWLWTAYRKDYKS